MAEGDQTLVNEPPDTVPGSDNLRRNGPPCPPALGDIPHAKYQVLHQKALQLLKRRI